MSSFLGKIRNLISEDPSSPLPHSEALANVYGGDLDSPEAFINRANKRAVNGDLDGAIEDFNEAIQLNPAKATAYFNRGFLRNTVGQFDQAILDFTEAIQLLPDYDEAFFQRAIGRHQTEDLQGAFADFSQALKINPFCIKAYYQRAEVLVELGGEQAALADYSQAILHVPKDANAYYRRGLFLEKLGEFPIAIKDFIQAIQYNPQHADAYFHRGYCYAQLGEEGKAHQDFSQALLYDPNHEAAQQSRTSALGALKGTALGAQPLLQSAPMDSVRADVEPVNDPVLQLEAADPVPFETSLEAPSAPSVDVSWSEAMPVESSSPSIAAADTVDVPPESVDDYFDRARERAVQGDWSGAIADYTAIIERDPQNKQAYYQRGQSRNALGDADAAMQDLEQAIHWTRLQSLSLLKDFNGELAETIATLKGGLSDRPPSSNSTLPPIEAAIEAASQAIRDNPNNAQAFFERGKSRALLGDLEGAVADYTESIRLDPTQSEVYYKRGRSRSALGDEQGSTEDLNHAIRQKPLSKLSPPANIQEQVPSVDEPLAQHQSKAEILFSQGLDFAKAGERVRGIKALASALSLFLEQQNMDRYQATMDLIKQYSNELPS